LSRRYLSDPRAGFRLSIPARRSLPKIVAVRERLRRPASRVPSTPGTPRSRGNSGNADPVWRAVFVTFISRQVRANIARFLSEFGCNARIIRIELERGGGGGGGTGEIRKTKEREKLVLFRVLIRITRVCLSHLQDYPFSWSPSARGTRFQRDAKSFRYMQIRSIFHVRARARATVFRDFARRFELSSRTHGDFTGGNKIWRCKDCNPRYSASIYLARRTLPTNRKIRTNLRRMPNPGDLRAMRFLAHAVRTARVLHINDSSYLPHVRLEFNIRATGNDADTMITRLHLARPMSYI